MPYIFEEEPSFDFSNLYINLPLPDAEDSTADTDSSSDTDSTEDVDGGPTNPFDVTNPTGPTRPNIDGNPFNIGESYLDQNWPGLSQNFQFLLRGMSGYAEEMDNWFNELSRYEDILYVQELNSNLTDNVAYAYLDHFELHVDVDKDGVADYHYYDGDIVDGSDWDNNGQIDILEAAGFFTDDGVLA